MLTIKVTRKQFIALSAMSETQITNVLSNFNVPPKRLDHIEWNEKSIEIHDRCLTTSGGIKIDNSHRFTVSEKNVMPFIAEGIKAEWAVNL